MKVSVWAGKSPLPYPLTENNTIFLHTGHMNTVLIPTNLNAKWFILTDYKTKGEGKLKSLYFQKEVKLLGDIV